MFELPVALCYRSRIRFSTLEGTMRPTRHRLPILAIAIFVCLAPLLVRAQSSDPARISITREVMGQLAHEQLAPVRARFSFELKDSLSEDRIKTVLKELADGAGVFQKEISEEAKTVQGTRIYIARSQFDKSKVELHLAFNESNEITQLVLVPVSDLAAEGLETAAKNVVDLLQKQRFDDVTGKFNDRMKGAMPANRLEASWTHVLSHLGQFKGIKSARKDIEFEIVDVHCEFEKGSMIVRVAFDPFGKVGGLWMLPAAPENNSQI